MYFDCERLKYCRGHMSSSCRTKVQRSNNNGILMHILLVQGENHRIITLKYK